MTADATPLLRLGHSPDPDDAFMWWPLLERDGGPAAIDTGRFRFEVVAEDIEALNHRSDRADLEITAMSCAQYPRVQARYALTACGASMGDGYGPKLVAGEGVSVDDLTGDGVIIAIPGERTSAFGCASLRLGPGSFRYQVVPFEEIIDRVASGEFAAGLVIHEGQLTFGDAGLRLLEDLGAWWTGREGLPLPLGVNAIRRDLDVIHGEGALEEITAILRRSVEHALEHRDESIRYALEYARGIAPDVADRFVSMYVNRWTLEFGPTGRRAVMAFLTALAEAGLAPAPAEVDFVPAAV
ncbi:MAG: menaquinone biosynthesis family protein [Planctomycetota bacterium]|jgi:1,4-dihydroxy-6-naphthoate synthase